MKIKYVVIALVSTVVLANGCKRDWTCTCTYASGTTPTVYNYGGVTEDEANELCQQSLAAGIGGNCTVD